MSLTTASVSFASTWNGTIGNTTTWTVNYTDVTNYFTDTTISIETSTAPTTDNMIPMPIIGNTEDLIIFASTITGVLFLAMLAAFIGWICDQVGAFGDPIGNKLRKTLNKKTSTLQFPRVNMVPRANGDTGVPQWMAQAHHDVHMNDGADNQAYEDIPAHVLAQHHAAEQLDQTIQEIDEDDEFSDENEYDDIGNHEIHRIRPSQIKAMERKKSQRYRNRNAQVGNTSSPAIRNQYLSPPNTGMYETSMIGSADSAYSTEIVPTIPPRD
ncbi:uncharacterized protein LOC120345895 [Styela clava]